MEFYEKRDTTITAVLNEVEKRHFDQEAGRRNMLEKYGIKDLAKPEGK